MKFLAALFVLLASLDLWIAAFVLQSPEYELNPLASWVWSVAGFRVLSIVKLSLTVVVVALAYNLPATHGAAVLAFACTVVVAALVAGSLILPWQ